MTVFHPGIPGKTNLWYPSQGQARRVALARARRAGLGYTIAHHPRPAVGMPHYHVAYTNGRPVEPTHPAYGHIFYGRRPPRKAYPGRPWRESERGGEAELEGMLQRVDRAVSEAMAGRTRGGGPDRTIQQLIRANTTLGRALHHIQRGATSAAVRALTDAQTLLRGSSGTSASQARTYMSEARSSLTFYRNQQRALHFVRLAMARTSDAIMARRRQLGRP